MVIILNGTSSSGKSSIAKALKILSPEPFLHVGIDLLYAIMPPSYINSGAQAAQGFKIVTKADNPSQKVDVEFGAFGQQVRDCSPALAQIFMQANIHLIVDEVLIGDRFLRGYVETFNDSQTYFIGITCDLNVLKERELLRNNRAIGLAESQYHSVHAPERFYDLVLDSSRTSQFDCAQQVLDFIKQHPEPTALKKCAARMGMV
jgi:chloramphenicol 3-O phosphotransferase